MQASSVIHSHVKRHRNRKPKPNIGGMIQLDSMSFQAMCKKLNIKHYGTNSKYKNIECMWNPIIQEINMNNIICNTFEQLHSYLQEKYYSEPIEKKFKYEFIIREINKYSLMAEEFNSNSKIYIRRLHYYAKSRYCKNMTHLKNELDNYLSKYNVKVDYSNEDNRNDYDKQEWLILCRYICDFLEEEKNRTDIGTNKETQYFDLFENINI